MPPTATSTHNANGNQVTRKVGGVTHTLTYDAENRLTKVMNGSTTIATFVYDADGQRVKSTLNGVTTTFVGNYYEKTGTNITKYYYAGAARVAMRNTSVKYLFGDQLGSTSVTTSSSGAIGSQERYKPFGEMYYTSGTLPTRYTFTGQYSYAAPNEIGLLYYGARFYDPVLGRFAQADTIIPGAGNPQSWDRYSYVNNSPLMYTDPSGHWMCDIYDPGCIETTDDMTQYLVMRYRSGIDVKPGSNNPGEPIADFWDKDNVHVSADLVEFTLQWEKYHAKFYTDSNGNCTIGFGHMCGGEDISKYEGYDFMDFWDLFLEDLQMAETGVRATFQNMDNYHFGNSNGYKLGASIPINQAEFDALVDFSFNAGKGRVYELIVKNLITGERGSPTKDTTAFQSALQITYTGSGGIGIRREQELNIFLYGNYNYAH